MCIDDIECGNDNLHKVYAIALAAVSSYLTTYKYNYIISVTYDYNKI